MSRSRQDTSACTTRATRCNDTIGFGNIGFGKTERAILGFQKCEDMYPLLSSRRSTSGIRYSSDDELAVVSTVSPLRSEAHALASLERNGTESDRALERVWVWVWERERVCG